MKTFVAEPLLIIPRQCLWPTASCLIATEGVSFFPFEEGAYLDNYYSCLHKPTYLLS